MGREIGRDRQRDAAIRRRVTTVAALLRTSRAGVVLRVIESYVEAFVESRREILQRRIAALRVGVTDQTHRNPGRRELSAMTIDAGFVNGKTRRGGIVRSLVTRVTGEGTVSLAGMQKLRVVGFGTLRSRGHTEGQSKKTYTNDPDLVHLRFIGGRCAIR